MEQIYEKRGYLLENFRLFHLGDAQGTNVEYHYHGFHKLLLILSGHGGYVVEGKRYELRAGDVVMIGSHCVHKPEFQPGVPYERIILYIDPAFLKAHSTPGFDLEQGFFGEQGHVLRLGTRAYQEILSKTQGLEQELCQQQRGWDIVSQGMLLGLCVELGRAKDIQHPKPLEPKDPRMMEICNYLDAHLEEDISIDQLAQIFYLSKYHMMRRFRQETGTTIHGYLTEKRLLMARDLIRQGMPGAQACFQCGFGSYSAFSRAYGKFFGVTPMGRSSGGQEETYE